MAYKYYIDIWSVCNMEEIKNNVSDAQRAAQKKYDQKTKMVSIKYTPADMEDYERLKIYLEKTGKSKNGFIKELVNNFFDSGEGEIYETIIEKKLHSTQSYYNYVNVSIDDITPLVDYFGKVLAKQVLNIYDKILKETIISQRADCERKLCDWLEDIRKGIEKGDFDDKTVGARYRILKEGLYSFFGFNENG